MRSVYLPEKMLGIKIILNIRCFERSVVTAYNFQRHGYGDNLWVSFSRHLTVLFQLQFTVMNQGGLVWAEHLAQMEDMRNIYKLLVGTPG
jgi:hypothetical protein